MFENLLNRQEYDANAKTMSSEFFRNVYTYMFVALAISGGVAYMAGTPEFFQEYFVTSTGLSPLFYVIVFAPLGVAILIQRAYNSLGIGVLYILYAIYSILIGLCLSTIFLVYDLGTISSTFFITAGAFAAMAILGYTTKVDLSKMGSILYMAFIGILIASVVNFFMNNSMLDFIISVIGVFVFTGLTAYEMQNLKYISNDETLQGVQRSKLELIGGLKLYILFVNLFVSLLRLVGGSRD